MYICMYACVYVCMNACMYECMNVYVSPLELLFDVVAVVS